MCDRFIYGISSRIEKCFEKSTNADISKNEYSCSDCKKYRQKNRIYGICEATGNEVTALQKSGSLIELKPHAEKIQQIIKKDGTNGLGYNLYDKYLDQKLEEKDLKEIAELEKNLTNLV